MKEESKTGILSFKTAFYFLFFVAQSCSFNDTDDYVKINHIEEKLELSNKKVIPFNNEENTELTIFKSIYLFDIDSIYVNSKNEILGFRFYIDSPCMGIAKIYETSQGRITSLNFYNLYDYPSLRELNNKTYIPVSFSVNFFRDSINNYAYEGYYQKLYQIINDTSFIELQRGRLNP